MPDISVILAARGWRAAVKRPEEVARRAAVAALQETGATGAMTVLLTDDTEVKRLNGQHRAKAKPTNVLSFPAEAPGRLGDVALALGVVRREARDAGRRTAAHLAHLVAHGALHLAGHDHLEAGEARRMERIHRRAIRRAEAPVPPVRLHRPSRRADRQIGVTIIIRTVPHPIPDRGIRPVHAGHAQRRHHRVVEPRRARQVAHGDGDMVQHQRARHSSAQSVDTFRCPVGRTPSSHCGQTCASARNQSGIAGSSSA